MAGHHADVTDVSAGPWISTRRRAKTAAQATLPDVTDGQKRTPDRSTPSTRGTRSAGNGRRSSTRTAVCRETSMASTASARARRRRSARPAGACVADSVRARREGAHGRSAGRSPRLRTSGAGYPQRSVHAGHRAGRRPRSAHHARALGSFRCRRPDGPGPARSPRPDPDPPAPVCYLLDDQRRQPRKQRAHKLIDITHSSS